MKKIFFCFWPFVNAEEVLEITTKLPVKLNDPVIDVGTLMCQLSNVRYFNYIL
jgi:hypothetical protein